MDNPSFIPKPWYRRPDTVKILAVGVVICVPIFLYLFTTAWYLWQIKNGTVKPPVFLSSNTISFSQSKAGSAVSNEDRSKLESGLNPFLMGNTKSKVTIVAFMDFRCPFSKAEHEILNKLTTQYVSGRQVSLIFRNFPSESLYPDTTELSKIGFCAFKQNRFLAAYNYLYENQDAISLPLTDDGISMIADGIGMNFGSLKTCLSDAATIKKINDDFVDGANAGVRGTPTYFVNGEKVEGVIPFDSWKRFLDYTIKEQGSGS